jgi:hypothetical protein
MDTTDDRVDDEKCLDEAIAQISYHDITWAASTGRRKRGRLAMK